MTVSSPGCSPAFRSGVIDAWRALACPAVVAFHTRANCHEPELHPAVALLRLGAASYSIYLVHIPFIIPARNLARRFISPDSLACLGVWFGRIRLGLAAGLLFFLAVERPCERLRVRFRLST